MPIENEIVQFSTEEMNKLFEASPSGTVSADSIEGGIKVQNNTSEFLDQIPNLEDLEVKNDDKEKVEDKIEDTVEDDKSTDNDSEKDKSTDKEEKPIEEINNVLKNTVEYLIEKGIWADWDGRKDLDVTEEVYAELASQQNQNLAYEIVDELVNSTGVYGKAIINHIKAGGNPDEIIDIFKEQKAIEQIDTSTETGKQVLIEKYYKDVLGWKTEKVEKTIKRLISDNEIESEFSDAQEHFKKHHKEQLDNTEKATKEKEKIEVERKQTFISNIGKALDQEELSSKEKSLISESILKFKHELSDGKKVNDFYLKFAEMQSDPKSYIKLVRFVMDPENFEKQIRTKEETKAAVKNFNFIKGNKAVDKVKAADMEIEDKNKSQEYKGTNFSFALKNKK